MENIQEETRELTPEEQEERIKKEKIKIALEKMKAASVQKLVVKVFDDNLETSKTMLIDQTWTVRDIVSKMVKKNDVEVDPNWSLIEKLPEMHLGMAISCSKYMSCTKITMNYMKSGVMHTDWNYFFI